MKEDTERCNIVSYKMKERCLSRGPNMRVCPTHGLQAICGPWTPSNVVAQDHKLFMCGAEAQTA